MGLSGGLRRGWRAWQGMRRFTRLPAADRRLVFYSEDVASWAHLGPLVEELLARGETITYLTSAPDDPRLAARPGLAGFFIGSGAVRTTLFRELPACTLVTTMPDLDSFHLRRSRRGPVHYVYVFHSLVSTHMIYRPAAFDGYDTVLCAGPHHEAEIRAREWQQGLPPKQLVAHGYGRLDALRAALAARPPARAGNVPHVLVAPSWGDGGLLELCGGELLTVLLGAGFRVTVRPHPMTRRRCPLLVRRLEQRYGEHCLFETDVGDSRALLEADILVSDWSGVAFEFAFAREHPVLFVDVPRKVNNPDYPALGREPVEASARTTLGRVLPTARLHEAPVWIAELLGVADEYAAGIRTLRRQLVHHLDASAAVGATALQRIAAGEPLEAGREALEREPVRGASDRSRELV